MTTLVTVIGVSAAVLCSNANYDHSERCKAPVEAFEVVDGEAYGHLTSGVNFTQTNVSNDLGVRLQRFQMENAFWYVSDKGVIEAESDLQALSIYLSSESDATRSYIK